MRGNWQENGGRKMVPKLFIFLPHIFLPLSFFRFIFLKNTNFEAEFTEFVRIRQNFSGKVYLLILDFVTKILTGGRLSALSRQK